MNKLYRNKDDRVVFGVCSGLAKYFNIDATLIRLIFITGAFLKGVTILIYIILAVLIPERERVEIKEISPGKEPEHVFDKDERQKFLAYLLILIGVFVFVQELIPFFLSDSQIFAIALILIGIALLFRNK
jgi:phage shock protein PspC (stress-responsive transcriptional regulator)